MKRAMQLLFCAGTACLLLFGMAEDSGMTQPDGQLSVYAGVTQYPNPERDSLVLLEFSFSVKRHEFDFFPADSPRTGLQARVFAQATLIGIDGIPVDSAFTYFALRAEDQADAVKQGIRVFNRIALAAQPGLYSARLTVIDVSSKRQGEAFIDQVSVTPIEHRGPSLSELLFAYRVLPAGAGSNINTRLVKNGYEVIPNPLSIFSVDDSLVFIYAEAYNLTGPHSQSDRFRMRLELLDEDSALVVDLGGRAADKPGASVVIAESFPIAKWAPGLYYVRLSLYDGMSDSGVVRLQPFRIVSPEELQAKLVEFDRFDPYDTLATEHKLNLVHYLLTPNQKATMNKLTDQGQLNYLAQFWKDLDPDPYTPVNEYRVEMISRYEYANRMFSTNAEKDNGWRTDRGRIYLSYGPYDQIYDMHAPRVDTPPYQVWYYFSLKDGLYFVFEDEYRDNDYRLVHSNDRKEVRNREWEERIQSGEIDRRQ